MGGRTTIKRLHGGVLPSRVLTDRGLTVVHSTASSRCGDNDGLEYTSGGALLRIFYLHKAVVATPGLSTDGSSTPTRELTQIHDSESPLLGLGLVFRFFDLHRKPLPSLLLLP
jgi:hypothetical protein